MSAAIFVGRVGGLAVALGVGVSVFSGTAAVAWADGGSQSDSGTASAGNTNRQAHAGARKAGAAAARKARTAAAAAPAAVADQPSVPMAKRTVKARATTPPIEAAPTTTYFDGVLQGNLNVSAKSGCGEEGSSCELVYKFAGSSDGGKANLNNIPNPLDTTEVIPGSFTFLPYATWIKPNAPTNLPTPTGTQTFDVRVTENTKFDQTITSIPLVGIIAKPIINVMQQLPLISTLLAPLIGASLLTTVEMNIGTLVPANKQVAYTYTISSFDGTPISMNYFPASQASLVLPGQRQATIFNGPGLGSPGETNPYGLTQAANSVPGLPIMRGQGLPGDFALAPLGFNVITWDPRGEFASGGTLQLDNPFFEGRDVSALIDWSIQNTPLLFEKNRDEEGDPYGDPVPDIAMMGGSYGGGIQMTTVDPRIKTIVPSIAWNSLNDSLYPNNVFKSGWANILALALLQAGADVNPLINLGILRGNLFGSLSETQQAALASSGPTVLLKKLSIPTMYDQGTVDALFPLQQAINNARTQLEENPFFVDATAAQGFPSQLVKMIWFCGGHGVCTDQTVAQQTQQSTIMFLENILWANEYSKQYINDVTIPPVQTPLGPITNLGVLIGLVNTFGIAQFQWWDQNGNALASYSNPVVCATLSLNCGGMPWTDEFQNTAPITASNTDGGRITWTNSRSGPLTTDDPAAQFELLPDTTVCDAAPACSFPLNNAFATKADNAVSVNITVPRTTNGARPSVVVGAPLVTMTYSGRGRGKAVYAQIVDNATGQVLGNINTPIPVILDGKEHTITDFAIGNIAYTAPGVGGDNTLTLQIVGRSSNFKAQRLSVDISTVSVTLPTTNTATPNPILGFLPS